MRTTAHDMALPMLAIAAAPAVFGAPGSPAGAEPAETVGAAVQGGFWRCVFLEEHVAARRAADADGAVRGASGARRSGDHRRRRSAGARRSGLCRSGLL